MRNVLIKIATVAVTVLTAIVIFLSGYLIAEAEATRESRVDSVIKKGRYYRQMVENTPTTRLSKSDREQLLEILDGETTNWWDDHYVVEYELAYVDDNGDTWTGLGRGSIDGLMEDISRCEWVDVKAIETY